MANPRPSFLKVVDSTAAPTSKVVVEEAVTLEGPIYGPPQPSSNAASVHLVVWQLENGHHAFGVLECGYESGRTFQSLTSVHVHHCADFATQAEGLQAMRAHQHKGYRAITRDLLMERDVREIQVPPESRPPIVFKSLRSDTASVNLSGMPFALPEAVRRARLAPPRGAEHRRLTAVGG